MGTSIAVKPHPGRRAAVLAGVWLIAYFVARGILKSANLSFDDWSYAHIWYSLPVFYFGPIGFVTRRYAGDGE
jgi:hypothetical protein